MNQPAFQLGTTDFPNDRIWSQLPTPKSVRTFELEPGAEAMVDDLNKPTYRVRNTFGRFSCLLLTRCKVRGTDGSGDDPVCFISSTNEYPKRVP